MFRFRSGFQGDTRRVAGMGERGSAGVAWETADSIPRQGSPEAVRVVSGMLPEVLRYVTDTLSEEGRGVRLRQSVIGVEGVRCLSTDSGETAPNS